MNVVTLDVEADADPHQAEENGGLHRPSPQEVYVIMHDFVLEEIDVGLRIFVDSTRSDGNLLQFEAEQWFVKALG